MEKKNKNIISRYGWLKNYLPFLLLILVPSITYLLAFNVFKNDVHWWSSPDPTYAYYLDAVSFAKNFEIGMYQHPGTPEIVLCGTVIKIVGLLKGLSGEKLVNDLILNAEYYIFISKNFFTILYCLTLYVFGIYLFRFSKNFFFALLAQSTPIIMGRIPIMVTWLKPEGLLLISGMLLSMVLISLYKKDFEQNKVKYLFFFSAILGFALACKINFIPLLLIPIIVIPKFKNKFYFGILTTLFFVVFTIPILPKYGKMLDYFIHRSQLSASRTGVISLFGRELLPVSMPFYFCLIVSIIYLVVLLKLPGKYKSPIQSTTIRILGAIIVASIVTIFMVIKHPHGFMGLNARYLISVFGLTGTMIFVILYSLKEINFLSRLMQKIILLIVIAGVGWFAVDTTKSLTAEAQKIAVLGSEVAAFRKGMNKRFKNCGVIVGYKSRHPAFAYLFGNKYASFKLVKELEKLFPEVYFFIPKKTGFYDWNYKRIKLKEIIGKYKCLILFDVSGINYPPLITDNLKLHDEMELLNQHIYSIKVKKKIQ